MSNTRKAAVVAPGHGLSIWWVGDKLTFKVRSEHTACDFVMAELDVLPGGGPPPHMHVDEMFYVLEGEIIFTRDETYFSAGPGTALFLPRGKVHTFTNRTNAPAKALLWASPSNFEAVAMEFGIPCADSVTPPPPDAALMARLMKASERYGLHL